MLVVVTIVFEPITDFGRRPGCLRGLQIQLWLIASVFVSSHTLSTFSCHAYGASRVHGDCATLHRIVAVEPAGGLDSLQLGFESLGLAFR